MFAYLGWWRLHPQVWEEWLADPDGLLGVAELGGQVVGVFKLTKFPEQEWYMEGLRVHPDFQGRELPPISMITCWRPGGEWGVGSSAWRPARITSKCTRCARETGFKRVAEFIPYRAPSAWRRDEGILPA